MENIIKFLSLLLIVIPSIVTSQNLPKDSLLGHVKKIREKVIFLTEKENPQFLYNDDYGHSGFMGPESTISKFFNMWYNSNLCYYINYERHYDENRKITNEIWFGKKDNFINSYRYLYDKKSRLISSIDSTAHSIYTQNHYFNEHGEYVDENIISENIQTNHFSHYYNKYKNGKVIRSKKFDEDGFVDEYINHYNDKGKIVYKICKNPSIWKKLEGNSWSLSVHDSIGKPYRNMEFEYNEKGKLIKKIEFDIQEYTNNIIPGRVITNIFKDDHLLTQITETKGNNPFTTYYNYRYDKYGRLTEKYCCDKNISKSGIIQKYKYKNDKISSLNYSYNEPSERPKMVNYKISYSYKYDNNNNWTEIIKIVNDVKLYKWVREIEYY